MFVRAKICMNAEQQAKRNLQRKKGDDEHDVITLIFYANELIFTKQNLFEQKEKIQKSYYAVLWNMLYSFANEIV